MQTHIQLTLADLTALPLTELFAEHLWLDGRLERERCLELHVEGHRVLVCYVLDTAFRDPVLRTVRHRMANWLCLKNLYLGDE